MADRPTADRPLRALLVTTALVPEQLQTWRSAALADGVDLHVAGSLVHDTSESYLADLAIPEWGTVHELRPHGWVSRGRLWWNLDGLEGLIEEIAPDVVHVHSEVWGRLVGQALRTDAPVVAHGAENVSLVHGGRVEGRIRRATATRNARRLAGYASWNSDGVRLLRQNGLRAGAPTAVAPAIVPDPAPFLAVEPSVSGDGPVRIGVVGRLVPEKGVQWVLSALDGIPDVELVVIGTGAYEPHLRRMARRRQVTTDFRGKVEAEDMPEVLAGLDIVVVPSLTRPGWAEQFGRVVCEAMLVGVPVVSSDSGSLGEVVGTGGVLVPELDHGAMRAALLDLIDDPEARRALGRRGRAWALDQLVPAVAADRLVGLWREVAAAS